MTGRLKRSDTRVDAPHTRRTSGRDPVPAQPPEDPPVVPEEAVPEEVAARPVNLAVAFVEQVQTQAAQLAEHLQRQRDDLDRREAELNARSAAVDNQVRGARLWLEQREAEIEARGTEVHGQQQAIQDHLAQLGLAVEDATLADIRGELTRQADLLKGRARQLDETERALTAREAKLEQQTTQLEVRQDYYDKTDELLADERAGLATVRKQLEAERIELDEQRHQQLQQLRETQSRTDAELARQRRELQQRSASLEKREAALETLHDQLMHSQRDVLEVRLATEEIWSELSGMVSPAALTRSIAQVRAKLAEQFSLTKTELATRQTQIQELAAELTSEHERLELQKAELHEWVARQQGELQRQAARDVAARRQYDRQRIGQREETLAWREERLEYQREIRRLLAIIEGTRPAAAA